MDPDFAMFPIRREAHLLYSIMLNTETLEDKASRHNANGWEEIEPEDTVQLPLLLLKVAGNHRWGGDALVLKSCFQVSYKYMVGHSEHKMLDWVVHCPDPTISSYVPMFLYTV